MNVVSSSLSERWYVRCLSFGFCSANSRPIHLDFQDAKLLELYLSTTICVDLLHDFTKLCPGQVFPQLFEHLVKLIWTEAAISGRIEAIEGRLQFS